MLSFVHVIEAERALQAHPLVVMAAGTKAVGSVGIPAKLNAHSEGKPNGIPG